MTIDIISDNLLCSGCGSCLAACNKDAISMHKTQTMGLLYAKVDNNKCVNCGVCMKVCPSKRYYENEAQKLPDQIISGHVGRSLNDTIFRNAQSGGMVTAILVYLFENHLIEAAVTCQMEFGKPTPSVRSVIVTSAQELSKCQKSCYTQVDVVSALKYAKRFRHIAVVGLPCHIEGVSNLERLNLVKNISYKIGLICEQSYSDAYMNALIGNSESAQKDIWIEYKKKDFIHRGVYYSYQNAPVVISGRQEILKIEPKEKRVFFKDFFVVPKCRLCDDKLNRQADIVLGDPWGLKGHYDEKEGDSVIIVRTYKAEALLKEMSSQGLIKLAGVSIEEIKKGQRVEEREKNIKECDFVDVKNEWQQFEAMSRCKIVTFAQKQYKFKKRSERIICYKQKVKRLLKVFFQ